ncbi:tRNA pseudouridine synthase A [Hyphomicrobium denitrificans 1NES1]|uniref:tRNA pseudouridine synthase A n=1 Tax=Hyphomicrobium denitrificans 1NES1 TaxID=670307 RepID=N0BA53_9HYPH|nr:tRNA pseudouridine(38-40) synthase TruA [Hyphomicrobium denitrificans]AGK59142.1 tRNA pseudouridine synthase A [Hyphomicrobium denitrificans 1NES1]
MSRYRITIEYDGTPFIGWQRQAEGVSIQGALETAIRRFSGEAPGVRGAGRTDAGVHALGQVAHFDLEKTWEPGRIRDAMNFHLRPNPIAVLSAARVDDTFDARFSAVKRHYEYRILTRRSPPILQRNRVWWTMRDLDAGAMHEAAQVLLGKHDFTTFRAAQCQAQSPVKTLDVFDVSRQGEEIVCRVSARSFLHHQVRSMVGSLKLVGEGKWTRQDLADSLEAADREACGPVAPAAGLYLVRVDYE